MAFLTIQLPRCEDFLVCTLATSVLSPDERRLDRLAHTISSRGYEWCIRNRHHDKSPDWLRTVQRIEEDFCWDKLGVGDAITAKVESDALEFGDIDVGGIKKYGGGCHRTLALAVKCLRAPSFYRPFDIELHC